MKIHLSLQLLKVSRGSIKIKLGLNKLLCVFVTSAWYGFNKVLSVNAVSVLYDKPYQKAERLVQIFFLLFVFIKMINYVFKARLFLEVICLPFICFRKPALDPLNTFLLKSFCGMHKALLSPSLVGTNLIVGLSLHCV